MTDEKRALDKLMLAIKKRKEENNSYQHIDADMNINPNTPTKVVESEYEKYIRELKEKEG